MNFTSEQVAAITTHDRNLIVTAGAGSGKTRVLVARFMDLLRSNPAWTLPSVVAITFTEKAAREMRDRVRAAIGDEIRAAAGDQTVLDRWLDHQAALTRARIGTIHALCASILRANPAEAHLDPAFEVLDETEAAILRDDAVDEALARLAAEDRPGTALLAAYGVQAVRRVLFQFAERSRAQTVETALQGDLIAYWRDTWTGAIAGLLDEVRADPVLREALDFVHPAELPADDKLSDVWRTVHTHTPALLDGAPAEFVAAMDVLIAGIDLRGGSVKNWGDKETLDAAKDALKLIRARMQDLQKTLPPALCPRDDDAAQWLIGWQDAIRLAAQIYADRKQDRPALDFDDLETRARDLLVEHDSVVARYAAEFNHILVDEFQDTNAAQRDIIYRLAGVGEPGADGHLFVVGDPKQSIYAFRGADVSVFGAVRADLCQHGGLELPLSMSFRTHENLVTAFNDLFGCILTPQPGLAARYEVDRGVPMTAFRPAEPDHAQPVTIFAFQRPDKDAYPVFGTDDIRRWEAWTLAQHIHAQIAQGARIWDRGENIYRPLGYGDVAILFQSMTRVPLYEEIFKAAGLPYVTVAGKGYYDRQEVWDLLNLLRALHNPADDLALAAVLRSPLFGLSDDALLSLRLARENGEVLPLWAALMAGGTPFFPADDLPARDFARRVLRDLRDMAGRAPIAEVLIRALDLTGFLATLTGLSDGARRRGNVEKLVRLARASGRVSLGAFNAYARDLTTREIREGEAAVEVEGAVNIMSVHASKGLEFPVVILADAAWSRTRRAGEMFTVDPDIGAACRLPTDDPDAEEPEPFAWMLAGLLADRRDQAERRRLLYVGATRAQDHLIISGSLYRSTERTWLRQWLTALGVEADDIEPQDTPYILSANWGECALHVPQTPTLPDHLLPRAPENRSSAWDDPAVLAAEPIAGFAPELPPLLADVPFDPTAPARALTATQLTRLGRAPYYDPTMRGWATVRDSVLFDAPDPLRPLPDRKVDEWALRRLVGEIVHHALQVWSLPDNTPEEVLIHRLETYAWAELSDDHQIKTAVALALDLLRRFASSPVRADLDRAQQIYRELPFAYRAGSRTLYGQIDVLYFDGRDWHVLDYKTAPVSWQKAEENAQRYYLQVGVYAQAVAASTGQTPHTHLYYIHPGRRVYVKPEDWRVAFEHLEDDLHLALDVGE